MTAIRMINATKSTAPKDAATTTTEGEELLLSSMMTFSVDIDLWIEKNGNWEEEKGDNRVQYYNPFLF